MAVTATGSRPPMKQSHRVVRFALVGVVNTAIDLGLYLALRHLGLPLACANLLSTTAGLTFSYLANRSFTFGDRAAGGRRATATRFLLTTGFGLWVVQPLVIAAAEGALERAGGPGLVASAGAKVVGIVSGVVWNYVAYDKFVFRHRAAESSDSAR